MNDLISVSDAAERFGLTEHRVRQLCAQGLGRRRDGRWLISESELARHRGVPRAEPLAHIVLGNMFIELGESIHHLRRDVPDLLERAVRELFKLAKPAVSEGTASEQPTTQ